MRFRLKKVSITNIYVYLVITLVLVTTSSIYIFIDESLGTLLKIILIGLCFSSLFIFNSFVLNTKLIIYALIIIFIFSINSLMFDVVGINVFLIVLRMISLVLFVWICKVNNVDLLSKISKTILFIAAIFLFFYFLFDSGLFPFTPKELAIDRYSGVESNDYTSYIKSYYGIYYRTQTYVFMDIRFNRLNGLFTEGGMYQLFLNFAFIYELFAKKKINVLSISILGVSLFLTFSTMGYICAFIILFLRMCKSKSGLMRLLSFLVTLVLVYLAYNLLSEKSQSSSYISRTSNIIEVFTMIFESPIFGHGYGVSKYSYSGLLTMITHFGIISFLFVIPTFFFSFYDKELNIFCNISFMICLFLGMINEPLEYSNFIFLLLGMGVVYFATEPIIGGKKWKTLDLERTKNAGMI